MTQLPSRRPNIAAAVASASNELIQKNSGSGAQPLPAAEIESLLKIAYENIKQLKSVSQDEEIGPGDVQYLRGQSSPQPVSSMSADSVSDDWTGNPEALLRQAEEQLARAILDPVNDSTVRSAAAKADAPAADRSANANTANGLTLEDLGNVDLDISIELGRTEILIEDMLKLCGGSVVALDKLAGDPVDILANGRLVARGELLVIDGKFGVRLSEVL